MRYKKIAQTTLLTALLTDIAHAEEVDTSIIEFSPSVGYFTFDSDRNLKDNVFFGVGLGLNFSRRFSALLHYSSLNSELSDVTRAGNIDMQKYHIDGMYYFNTESRWRPYVVAGYGQIDFDNQDGNNFEENNVNSGLGLYVRLAKKWSIRADVRNFYSFDKSYNDQTFMMTLGYRTGNGESD